MKLLKKYLDWSQNFCIYCVQALITILCRSMDQLNSSSKSMMVIRGIKHCSLNFKGLIFNIKIKRLRLTISTQKFRPQRMRLKRRPSNLCFQSENLKLKRTINDSRNHRLKKYRQNTKCHLFKIQGFLVHNNPEAQRSYAHALSLFLNPMLPARNSLSFCLRVFVTEKPLNIKKTAFSALSILLLI